jgi:hypothetical protein
MTLFSTFIMVISNFVFKGMFQFLDCLFIEVMQVFATDFPWNNFGM